jgi:hypothetical protein
MSLVAQLMVWERSRASGLELLALVAIADWADSDGRNAAPNVQLLASRVRLPVKTLCDLLLRLERDGELLIEPHPDRARLHLCCCYDPRYGLRESASMAPTS